MLLNEFLGPSAVIVPLKAANKSEAISELIAALNQNSNLARLSRVDTALTQQLGRSPTIQEIAKYFMHLHVIFLEIQHKNTKTKALK